MPQRNGRGACIGPAAPDACLKPVSWLRRLPHLALGVLACLAATLSFGQQDSQSPALDEGADRSARLLANARREGSLSLYASMAEKDLIRLVSEFERRYGIKVKVWRSGKNNVLRRAVTEARAGRFEVDVVHNPSPEMELLHRERLLQEVRSPHQRELIPEAVAPHREWAGPRVYIFVQAYNTNRVTPEELPKTFADLLDPRWKGRIAIEAKEQEWFFTLVREMGGEAGLKFFRDLVARNGLTVRNGNALLNNLVVAGEVPFALTLYSYLPEQSRRSGAPINWIALAPTVAYTDGIGVMKRAPHPHAAVLFYDFVLSDGQTLLAELNHVISHRRNEPYLRRFRLKFIELDAVLADYDRWTRIFEDTLYGRGAVSSPGASQ
jgi:iron(III) transport system substrate-binding protein